MIQNWQYETKLHETVVKINLKILNINIIYGLREFTFQAQDLKSNP